MLKKLHLCAIIFLCAFSYLLIGCASNRVPTSTSSQQAVLASIPDGVRDQEERVYENQSNTEVIAAPLEKQVEPLVQLGTGKYIKYENGESYESEIDDEGVAELNFQDVELLDVVKVILTDLLKVNYVVDPSISGKVTIEMQRQVPKSDLLPILDSLLEINGAALIQTKNFYKIVPRSKGLKSLSSSSIVSKDFKYGYRTHIVPLDYIAAEEMQKILEPYLSEHNLVRVDKKRNLLVLAGTPNEIRQLLETVSIFDVNWIKGMSVAILPIKNTEAKNIIRELEIALSGNNGELFDGLAKLLAIDRLNAVFAVSSKPDLIRNLQTWIRRLDVTSPEAGKRLFVYRVQNSKASDLAQMLSTIFNKANESKNNALALASSTLAPGTEPVIIRSDDEDLDSDDFDDSTSPKNLPPRTRSEESVSISSGSDIQFIADEVHNSLVVLATDKEYENVLAALHQLDVPPLQVLIEASIIQVDLNDNLEYGVEWFFKNNFGDDKRGRGLLDNGTAGIGPIAPGFSYTVIDAADNVRAALNALSQESTVKVLSSPSLMVLDNQTATINIGDQIPVPSRQSVSNINPDSPLVNEIDYRDTGVILTVTPRVNANGLVTMEVRQEVSNAVNTNSSNIDAPTIQQREIESVVAVHSGETVILGGLISENTTDSKSGVPVLHKVPIIGNLFGDTVSDQRRSELIVLIAPRAIKDKYEARELTREYRNKLKYFNPPRSSVNKRFDNTSEVNEESEVEIREVDVN